MLGEIAGLKRRAWRWAEKGSMSFTTDLSVLGLGLRGWQQVPFPVCWCCRTQRGKPQTLLSALTGHLEQITLPPQASVSPSVKQR